MRRVRKACILRGHRWGIYPPLPVQFCTRWRCEAQRVAPWVSDPAVREGLQRALDENCSSELINRVDHRKCRPPTGAFRFGERYQCLHGTLWIFAPGGVGGGGAWYVMPNQEGA